MAKKLVKAAAFALCIVLLAASILTACSNADSRSMEMKSDTTVQQQKKVEFRIGAWTVAGRKESIQKVIDEYKKIKPNVTINFEEHGQTSTDFDTWMAASLAGTRRRSSMDFSASTPDYNTYKRI